MAALLGSAANAQTPATPKLPLMVLRADAGVQTVKDGQVQNGCGANQPFTQDAPIWSVILRLDASGSLKSGTSDIPKIKSFPFFRDPATNTFYAVVVDGPSQTFSSVNQKGESLTVHVRNVLGQVNMAIEGLTLAQLTDVAAAVKAHASQFTGKLSSLGYTAKLYKVTGPKSESEFIGALVGDIDPTAANAQGLLAQNLQVLTTAAAPANQAVILDTGTLGSIQLVDDSFAKLNDNVKSILQNGALKAGNRAPAQSTAGGNADTLAGAPGAAGSGGDNPVVFAIDEPCFGFSVAPIVSGASGSLASTFRFRYDIYSAGGTSFLKLRANGDGALNGSYFNRAEGSAVLGVNNKGLVVVNGGAAFGYSFSRPGASVVDEWTASGKFQFSLPPVLFVNRAGMQSRPTVTVDGGGSGGRHAQLGRLGTTRDTSFVAKGAFAYTIRPSEMLSIDLTGGLGASSETTFFNGRRYFSNARVEIRYNVSKDYDFLARYDCGRRGPDYLKYCGWTTGFTMIRGR
jgi:hypothetical protein